MCIDPQLKIVLKTLLFTDFCLNLKCPVYIRKKLSKNAYFFLIRDLWWAVCQRGRAWAAVRPHSSCIHCHPWITTRWRHTEQVRHKWASMCICACNPRSAGCNSDYIVLLLCVTGGTALSLLTINNVMRTSPWYQMWVTVTIRSIRFWTMRLFFVIVFPLHQRSGF